MPDVGVVRATACAVLLLATPAWATERYVGESSPLTCPSACGATCNAPSDSGGCTNACTPCATVNYCIDQIVAGDTCTVADGTYSDTESGTTSCMTFSNLSRVFGTTTNCSVGSPCVVTADNVTMPPSVEMTGAASIAACAKHSYWTFRGFEFTTTLGVSATSTNNVVFDYLRCNITSSNDGATSGLVDSDNITISNTELRRISGTNCTPNDAGTTGLWLRDCDDCTLEDSLIYKFGQTGSIGALQGVSGSSNIILRRNEFHDNRGHGLVFQNRYSGLTTTNVLVENNIWTADPSCTHCDPDCVVGSAACNDANECNEARSRTGDMYACIDCTFRNNTITGHNYLYKATGVLTYNLPSQCSTGRTCTKDGLRYYNNLAYDIQDNTEHPTANASNNRYIQLAADAGTPVPSTCTDVMIDGNYYDVSTSPGVGWSCTGSSSTPGDFSTWHGDNCCGGTNNADPNGIIGFCSEDGTTACGIDGDCSGTCDAAVPTFVSYTTNNLRADVGTSIQVNSGVGGTDATIPLQSGNNVCPDDDKDGNSRWVCSGGAEDGDDCVGSTGDGDCDGVGTCEMKGGACDIGAFEWQEGVGINTCGNGSVEAPEDCDKPDGTGGEAIEGCTLLCEFTQCNDGLDNDQDGDIDSSGGDIDSGCDDPDGAGPKAAIDDDDETDPSETCNDGIDNDGDGLYDLRDSAFGGANTHNCTTPALGDGGCTTVADNEDGSDVCDNSSDDDSDSTPCGVSLVDFKCGGIAAGGDPGCTSPTDTSELGTAECDDGVDNDSVGGTDCNDADCLGPLGASETAVDSGANELGIDDFTDTYATSNCSAGNTAGDCWTDILGTWGESSGTFTVLTGTGNVATYYSENGTNGADQWMCTTVPSGLAGGDIPGVMLRVPGSTLDQFGNPTTMYILRWLGTQAKYWWQVRRLTDLSQNDLSQTGIEGFQGCACDGDPCASGGAGQCAAIATADELVNGDIWCASAVGADDATVFKMWINPTGTTNEGPDDWGSPVWTHSVNTNVHCFDANNPPDGTLDCPDDNLFIGLYGVKGKAVNFDDVRGGSFTTTADVCGDTEITGSEVCDIGEDGLASTQDDVVGGAACAECGAVVCGGTCNGDGTTFCDDNGDCSGPGGPCDFCLGANAVSTALCVTETAENAIIECNEVCDCGEVGVSPCTDEELAFETCDGGTFIDPGTGQPYNGGELSCTIAGAYDTTVNGTCATTTASGTTRRISGGAGSGGKIGD